MENLIDQYNMDLEKGNAEIEREEYTRATDLKSEACKWSNEEFLAELDIRVANYKNGSETVSPEDMRKRIEAIRKTGLLPS